MSPRIPFHDRASVHDISRAGRIRRRRSSTLLHLERLEDRQLLSAGSLDSSFGTGGLVTTDFSATAESRPNGVAIQSDGKVIEFGTTKSPAGYRAALARI